MPPNHHNPPSGNAEDWDTEMSYNTLSQLISKTTPDAGTVEYKYDKNGNLRFVKDAVHDAAGQMVYYQYDELNRVVEIGVCNKAYFTQAYADGTLPSSETDEDNERIKYVYDSQPPGAPGTMTNLKGRLAKAAYRDMNDTSPPYNWGYTYYSYDNMGRVKTLWQDLLGSMPTKSIEYEYDRLGKVTKISYQDGNLNDNLYIWYDYDAAGRLWKVYTSTIDSKPATSDAQYTYWPTGQVKQLILGNNVQTIDYEYNTRDWLAEINDGALYGSDKYAMSLDYTSGGYGNAGFFNGNVAKWISKTSGLNTISYQYDYDGANRLLVADCNDNTYDVFGLSTNNNMIEYDPNGNILALKRGGGSVSLENYHYIPGTNKLDYTTVYTSQAPGNYAYDANGNMIQDAAKGITTDITYDYRNLPTHTVKSGNHLYCAYDANGNRVYKKYNQDQSYYIRGADGKTIAVYDCYKKLKFWNIWGLDLIGRKYWKY